MYLSGSSGGPKVPGRLLGALTSAKRLATSLCTRRLSKGFNCSSVAKSCQCSKRASRFAVPALAHQAWACSEYSCSCSSSNHFPSREMAASSCGRSSLCSRARRPQQTLRAPSSSLQAPEETRNGNQVSTRWSSESGSPTSRVCARYSTTSSSKLQDGSSSARLRRTRSTCSTFGAVAAITETSGGGRVGPADAASPPTPNSLKQRT
mmetsp:Transcript_47563/g.151796  ORF Transcript_47563/g.151796 Transcript_47563/m.151796 type:complete len:207 (+) Transcript_47563:690-1310(+)